jgi:hypothetical protein
VLTQQQGGGPGESEPTWIARVRPAAGISVAALLDMSLGLDVWERRSSSLVVAAPESRLAELERRHLAVVDRWATRADYEAGMRNRSATEEDDEGRIPPAGNSSTE